jgi:hypothetical protein
VLRRTLFACVVLMGLSAGRAEALNARDVIALTKAGLGEPVLLALIEVDRSIFAIDAASIKELKEARARFPATTTVRAAPTIRAVPIARAAGGCHRAS